MALDFQRTFEELLPPAETPFTLQNDVNIPGTVLKSVTLIAAEKVSLNNIHDFLFSLSMDRSPDEIPFSSDVPNTDIPYEALMEIAYNADQNEYYALGGVLYAYLIYTETLEEAE